MIARPILTRVPLISHRVSATGNGAGTGRGRRPRRIRAAASNTHAHDKNPKRRSTTPAPPAKPPTPGQLFLIAGERVNMPVIPRPPASRAVRRHAACPCAAAAEPASPTSPAPPSSSPSPSPRSGSTGPPNTARPRAAGVVRHPASDSPPLPCSGDVPPLAFERSAVETLKHIFLLRALGGSENHVGFQYPPPRIGPGKGKGSGYGQVSQDTVPRSRSARPAALRV
jgi:hypothetical protein